MLRNRTKGPFLTLILLTAGCTMDLQVHDLSQSEPYSQFSVNPKTSAPNYLALNKVEFDMEGGLPPYSCQTTSSGVLDSSSCSYTPHSVAGARVDTVSFYDSSGQKVEVELPIFASGSYDTSFSIDGVFELDWGGGDDVVHDLKMGQDGKIYLASGAAPSFGDDTDLGVARLLEDGTPDASFNSTGRAIYTPSSFDESANALVCLPDGSLFLGGGLRQLGDNENLVLNYTSSGTLNTSFGTAGVVQQTASPYHDWIETMQLDSMGRPIVCGMSHDGPSNGVDIFILCQRFLADGSVDPGYAPDFRTAFGYETWVRTSALAEDGSLYIAGKDQSGGSAVFFVAKVTAAGAVDTSFGTGGIIRGTATTPYLEGAEAISLLGSGKILLVGNIISGASLPADRDIGAIQLNSDGSIDNSFGSSGVTTVDVTGTEDKGEALVVYENGSFFISGMTYNGATYDNVILSFNSDGSLNTGFASAGILTIAAGLASNATNRLAIDSFGRILFAGTKDMGTQTDAVLVRFYP